MSVFALPPTGRLSRRWPRSCRREGWSGWWWTLCWCPLVVMRWPSQVGAASEVQRTEEPAGWSAKQACMHAGAGPGLLSPGLPARLLATTCLLVFNIFNSRWCAACSSAVHVSNAARLLFPLSCPVLPPSRRRCRGVEDSPVAAGDHSHSQCPRSIQAAGWVACCREPAAAACRCVHFVMTLLS